jgi:hypothetical protein
LARGGKSFVARTTSSARDVTIASTRLVLPVLYALDRLYAAPGRIGTNPCLCYGA